MSAAIATLEHRAETLREDLDSARRSLMAHEKGALRRAREELTEQESIARGKRDDISKKESDLADLNSALHRLRGTRPIADRPQA